MMRQLCMYAVVGVIAAGPVGASAAVIMSDSFSRTLGNAEPANGPLDSNWGTNDNALGGSLSGAYVTTPDRTSGGVQQTVNGSEGLLRFGAAAISLDLHANPTIAGTRSYKVSFDFARVAASGFLGVFFGADSTKVAAKDGNAAFGPINQTADYAGEVEAAFLFQNSADAGRVQKFSFGVQDGGNFDNAYDDATAGTVATHAAEVLVNAPAGLSAGSSATYQLSIDGNIVTTVSAVLDGGPGTFGFTSNQAGARVDNLRVTAVPEPSMVSLSMLAMCGWLGMRRPRPR